MEGDRKIIREIKIKPRYESIEARVNILKERGVEIINFSIINSRYPEPKEYNVSFDISWIPDEEKQNWLAEVLGSHFIDLVLRSANSMRNHICENYQAFIRSVSNS